LIKSKEFHFPFEFIEEIEQILYSTNKKKLKKTYHKYSGIKINIILYVLSDIIYKIKWIIVQLRNKIKCQSLRITLIVSKKK